MPTAQDNVNKLTITVRTIFVRRSRPVIQVSGIERRSVFIKTLRHNHTLFGVKKEQLPICVAALKHGNQLHQISSAHHPFNNPRRSLLTKAMRAWQSFCFFLFKLGRKRFFEFLFVCDLFSDGLSAPNTKMPDSKKYIIV